MNCKRAEELLPLYAGRDLDEKRAQLITEHVQSCAACARLADEYREAVQLTKQFAAPVFSEGVYAGVRRRVLHDIQEERTTMVLSPSLIGQFRPRLSWAFAAALLFVSVFAIYFIINRSNSRSQLVNNPPSIPVRNQQKNKESSAGDPSRASIPRVSPQPSIATTKHQRRRQRDAIPERAGARMAKASDRRPITTEVLPKERLPLDADSAASEETLRMEIQTKDPNIRIIWFSQPKAHPVTPNLKGI